MFQHHVLVQPRKGREPRECGEGRIGITDRDSMPRCVQSSQDNELFLITVHAATVQVPRRFRYILSLRLGNEASYSIVLTLMLDIV